MRALHHCWAKIKQRVTKDSRDERFVRLVADVLDGELADERAGCDGEEKRTLKALQACLGEDCERLREVGKSIAAVAGLLKHERGRLEGKPGEYEIPDADVQTLLKLRLYNHLLVRLMREGRRLWPLCTDCIRARCPSEEAEGEHNATEQAAWKEKAAMRPFDVAKWLSKVVSVTVDYLALRSAVVSSTVAGALFDDRDRPPTIICAPNQRAPAKTAEVISEAQLKATLVKVGWEDVGEAEYAEAVDTLRRIVNKKSADASAASVRSAGESFVHCECALLAHLHDQGIEDTIAYIGVSKPSCGLCATYFACYREVTGSGITTARGTGTHDRLVQWQMPSLNDSRLDATLRAKMCEKLTEKLKAQAAEVRKQHRKSSQSNVASLPGIKELAPVPGFAAVEGSSIDVATSMYYM
ncbi:hypothetical protein K466DRAFT_347037 [Polyporus arcularius HHB13444]|uniref:Uncharacterized protein n=1 Tax=Polyporus arcularius HHB13444 TaxID=1314778 RepID=A0A5C3NXX4_9APHY|nr:hypothetical protein K466DRAFT_347037 [Polyporus arcularius HHB13444]